MLRLENIPLAVVSVVSLGILFVFGAGVVKGFAVTISLGIMISMFTATVLVRLMMTAWMRRVRPKQRTKQRNHWEAEFCSAWPRHPRGLPKS